MANGRGGSKKNRYKPDRDGTQFAILPFVVLDCKNFINLSHPAKSLLLEFARQYGDGYNGRLLCSMKHLKTRGFNSSDVVTRAKRELIGAGFIHETVMGHSPNKASWYALTWYPLDKLNGYDVGAEKTFVRSAYSKNNAIKITPFIPSKGIGSQTIAPSDGIDKPLPVPPYGAIKGLIGSFSIPSSGNHLDNHLK
jgi:hypothetical protein